MLASPSSTGWMLLIAISVKVIIVISKNYNYKINNYNDVKKLKLNDKILIK